MQDKTEGSQKNDDWEIPAFKPKTTRGSRAKPALINATDAESFAGSSRSLLSAAEPAEAASEEDSGTSKSTGSAAPEPKPGHPTVPPLHKGTLTFALGGIIILAIGFGGGWLGAAARSSNAATDVPQQKVVLEGQAAVISSIAKQVGPSVVSVDVTTQTQSSDPYASMFGGGTQQGRDAGTGIILTASGLVMTNRHVVPDGTTNVSVTLSDGTVFDNVKVVGRTSNSDSLDVAFLQIGDTKGKTLIPAKLGDSSAVKVGDPVVAIGNALGQFQNTVTSGIISGYGRSLQASSSDGSDSENLDNLFQTDAAINAGNSGGPLVNLDGQVIGMNTAMAADSQSIGFSIPINDLSGLIDGVKATGKLERPYLGVVYIPINNDVQQQYNLSVDQGAYIPNATQSGGQETVIAGGPADQAGVQPGDTITKIDGSPIDQTHSITSVLGKHKVGDSVTLTIVRGDKTITKTATLGAAPTSN